MAHILAIEAASDSFSVALHTKGDQICRTEAAPRMHSRLLYPVLNDVMSEAGLKPNQLDAVAFGKGPGSFTGLRIAASTAQGIGFACDIPLIGVSTLQAMAQQAFLKDNASNVISIMDARMNELYVGQYTIDSENGIMTPTIDDFISPISFSPKKYHLTTGKFHFCGHGLRLAEQFDPELTKMIESRNDQQVLDASSMFPFAIQALETSQILAPEAVELVYLREQSHWKTIKEQKLANKK